MLANILIYNLLLFSKLSALHQKLKVEIIDYIEFLEKKCTTSKPHPKAVYMKGTFKMADDFDTSLNNFTNT